MTTAKLQEMNHAQLTAHAANAMRIAATAASAARAADEAYGHAETLLAAAGLAYRQAAAASDSALSAASCATAAAADAKAAATDAARSVDWYIADAAAKKSARLEQFAATQPASPLAADALSLAHGIAASGTEPRDQSRAFFIAMAAQPTLFDEMNEMAEGQGFEQAGAVFAASGLIYEIGNNAGTNFRGNPKHWEMQFARLGLAPTISCGVAVQLRLVRHVQKNYPGLLELCWDGLLEGLEDEQAETRSKR